MDAKSRIAALATGTLLAALALSPAPTVQAKASHEGWPTNNCEWREYDPGPGCGIYWSHPYDEDGMIEGTELIDELLGGHGDDLIYGGSSGDVIWGDFKPCCQPSSQVDSMSGGPGRDFIYTSHGTNYIDAGPGNDVVRAHFGRGGAVDCGPGRDTLYISHRSRPRFRVRGCERLDFNHKGK